MRLSPPGWTSSDEIHLTDGESFFRSSCLTRLYTRTAIFGIDATRNSWMTIGETEGTPGLLATIGIDWSCWQITDVSRCDDDNGLLHITDGAVFLMNPDTGPSSR